MGWAAHVQSIPWARPPNSMGRTGHVHPTHGGGLDMSTPLHVVDWTRPVYSMGTTTRLHGVHWTRPLHSMRWTGNVHHSMGWTGNVHHSMGWTGHVHSTQ